MEPEEIEVTETYQDGTVVLFDDYNDVQETAIVDEQTGDWY